MAHLGDGGRDDRLRCLGLRSSRYSFPGMVLVFLCFEWSHCADYFRGSWTTGARLSTPLGCVLRRASTLESVIALLSSGCHQSLFDFWKWLKKLKSLRSGRELFL